MEKQRAVQRHCRIPMLSIVLQKDTDQQEPFFEHHAPGFYARQECLALIDESGGLEMVMLFSGGETHLRSICARQDWSFRGPH
jgi:hypothetical protein